MGLRRMSWERGTRTRTASGCIRRDTIYIKATCSSGSCRGASVARAAALVDRRSPALLTRGLHAVLLCVFTLARRCVDGCMQMRFGTHPQASRDVIAQTAHPPNDPRRAQEPESDRQSLLLLSTNEEMSRVSERVLVELKLAEDKRVAAKFKQAITVTRWCDLGDGSALRRLEWAAINGRAREEYDSFARMGRRAISGIFENGSAWGGYRGQGGVMNEELGEKLGEDGHGRRYRWHYDARRLPTS